MFKRSIQECCAWFWRKTSFNFAIFRKNFFHRVDNNHTHMKGFCIMILKQHSVMLDQSFGLWNDRKLLRVFYENVTHAVGIKEDDLPDDRVNVLYALTCTGLVYDRPLFIKNNTDTTLKVYILLFTFASSSALNLELTPDMKALEFIRVFERFIARQRSHDVSILKLVNRPFLRNLYCVIKKDSWKIIVKLWRNRDCFVQNRITYKWTSISLPQWRWLRWSIYT